VALPVPAVAENAALNSPVVNNVVSQIHVDSPSESALDVPVRKKTLPSDSPFVVKSKVAAPVDSSDADDRVIPPVLKGLKFKKIYTKRPLHTRSRFPLVLPLAPKEKESLAMMTM